MSLFKYLSNTVNSLFERRNEAGADGEVYTLMTTAIFKLEEAAKIQKDVDGG